MANWFSNSFVPECSNQCNQMIDLHTHIIIRIGSFLISQFSVLSLSILFDLLLSPNLPLFPLAPSGGFAYDLFGDLKFVPPGDLVTLDLFCSVFNLAAGKNGQGQAMLKIVARLRFLGNTKIQDADVPSHFQDHCVSSGDYNKLISSWKNHKGFCIGWKFTVEEKYDPPFWIPWKGVLEQQLNGDHCFCRAVSQMLK